MNIFKNKFLIFKIFFILTVNNAYAITGSEINQKLKAWLAEKNIISNPQFSKNKVFKECKKRIGFSDVSKNYTLIKVFCSDRDGWKIFIRSNLTKSNYSKKNKKNNLQKVFVLKRSLEKGETITLDSLKSVMMKKQSSFFTNALELVGRRLKQNLKKEKIIRPRHLFQRFDVNEGDQVIILSNVGKAYVSSSGIAQKSGKIGDILTVKNERSGKIIKGYLKKDKKIQVYR